MDTSQYNAVIGAALTIQQAGKNPAAVALGRLGGLKGGLSKSPAKTAAVQANGRLGGRPKGSKTHKSASEVSNG